MQERLALKVWLVEVSRDLGVRPDPLRSWTRQLAKRVGQAPEEAFPGEGRLPSAEEGVRQPRRKLETVKLERDFLKKATYASHVYQAALAGRGIHASMSRAGDCWDNAVVESFFATLEWELLSGAPL